ncbi:hypothetical protein F2981_04110 [Sinorhizobium meliloti]|nr:hypothetical protein [Sinorhizobium meliloti]
MLSINRRAALPSWGATAGSLILRASRSAKASARPLPSPVQEITINNTLDVWNEQSNVGDACSSQTFGRPDPARLDGQSGPVPGLATEWKRIDDKTLELKLRQGAEVPQWPTNSRRRRR